MPQPSPRRGVRTYPSLVAALACAGSLLAAPANSHDLVVKPGTMKDGQVPVEVMLTEVFFVGDVQLKPEAVSLQALSNGQKGVLVLALTPDPQAKALAAQVTAAGPSLVVAKTSRIRPAREEAGRPPEPATLA
ncbi:MAG: hypothetical protein B7Z15_03565, partial [Rhizobiales bacterium 32-66-8]